jgi:hypothetical protein
VASSRQLLLHGAQMILHFGFSQAEFAGSFQRFSDQRSKVVKSDESLLDQENNILDIGVESAVNLTERHAVGSRIWTCAAPN